MNMGDNEDDDEGNDEDDEDEDPYSYANNASMGKNKLTSESKASLLPEIPKSKSNVGMIEPTNKQSSSINKYKDLNSL